MKDPETKATYGLEYALFFGVPNNKLELIDGTSRWAFPFLSRAEGEVHFQQWLKTFRRWKQVEVPTPIRKSTRSWQVEVSGIRMELFPRPSDIRIPLWSLLGSLSGRHGGKHSGRVDIGLAPWTGVAPDGYYYRPGRQNIMIAGDYFCAAPDLIAEVLFAESRWLDRGSRMEVYRRAGVPHLWLIEPAQEIVEIYELRGHYEMVGRHGPGDSFATPLFP